MRQHNLTAKGDRIDPIQTVTFARITADITELLSHTRAHQKTGNRDGEEAVTTLVSRLRDEKGWKFPTRPNAAEDAFALLGFTIREEHRGRGQRRAFVSAPTK